MDDEITQQILGGLEAVADDLRSASRALREARAWVLGDAIAPAEPDSEASRREAGEVRD